MGKEYGKLSQAATALCGAVYHRPMANYSQEFEVLLSGLPRQTLRPWCGGARVQPWGESRLAVLARMRHASSHHTQWM